MGIATRDTLRLGANDGAGRLPGDLGWGGELDWLWGDYQTPVEFFDAAAASGSAAAMLFRF